MLLVAISAVSCNPNQPQSISGKAQGDRAGVIADPVMHQQVPIWSTSIPDAGLVTGDESYDDGMVRNVSKPTISIFLPEKKNAGAAVIVFPGGGYNKLAIELEGSPLTQSCSAGFCT